MKIEEIRERSLAARIFMETFSSHVVVRRDDLSSKPIGLQWCFERFGRGGEWRNGFDHKFANPGASWDWAVIYSDDDYYLFSFAESIPVTDVVEFKLKFG